MYKFKEILIDKGKYSYKEYEGSVGLMCPYCYSSIVLDTKFKIDITRYGNQRSVVPSSLQSIVNFTINKCPGCGKYSETNILIDPNIVEAIGDLNSKGYITTNSCEGHIVKVNNIDKISFAYVSFKNNKMISDIINKYPLPDEWEIDEDLNDITIRSFYGYDENNKDAYCSEKILNTRMNVLKDWVNSLP